MSNPILTAEQFRMAKAALRMSNPDLSEKTGLHRNTLNKVDAGEGSASTLNLLRLTFEQLGVTFVDKNGGPAGVRYEPSGDQEH